jgi:translation initiation factor IF-2
MTDKSIQELALSVERPVEKLLEQVREAGLPQRKADDIITAEQQDLVNHLKKYMVRTVVTQEKLR